jgi:hypothetical protein
MTTLSILPTLTNVTPDTQSSQSVSLDRARDFVYSTGTLFERALFAFLFEGASADRAAQTLLAYQNPDGGWGNGVEHDIRTPASHPMGTEYALGLVLEFGLGDDPAMREALTRTAAWCEEHLTPAGDLPVDAAVHAYPRAPWWHDVTSWPADSITGRLAALGVATPALLERTAQWAEGALSLDELRNLSQDSWRYRLYHYADYFLNVLRPDRDVWQQAIAAKVVELAQGQADAEAALGFGWAARGLPDGAIPQRLIERRLDALAAEQREDGGWPDPHDLTHWRPIRTIWALKTLRERRPALFGAGG